MSVSVWESLSEVWLHRSPLWGQGAWEVAFLGGEACWHKSSRRRSPLGLTQTLQPFCKEYKIPGLGCLRPNYFEGVQPHSSAENWIKDLLSMVPPLPSEQDPVSPTSSPSHQEAPTVLLSSSITEQTEWTPQSQKISQNDNTLV